MPVIGIHAIGRREFSPAAVNNGGPASGGSGHRYTVPRAIGLLTA
jgi:hypothetical protein